MRARLVLLPLVLLLGACASQRVPVVLPAQGGWVALTKAGLFRQEGSAWREGSRGDGLESNELRALALTDTATGELWVTYATRARAGATRLRPAPARTLTTQDGLLDNRVAQVVSLGADTYAFSYDQALDLGVSLRQGDTWAHRGPANSALRSGKIRRMVLDARGGLWLEYAKSKLGVTRLTALGATNYDTGNSALPYDTIDRIVAELEGAGLPGDQVWFVTVDGLTRYDLGDGAWKHYGRPHGQATDVLKFLGMDTLFSKAILRIQDVAVGQGCIWISTPGRIYRYDGQKFQPVPAAYVEGLSRLRYARVAGAGNMVWVSLINTDSREIPAIASYQPGQKWERYQLRELGLAAPAELILSPLNGKVAALAPEWGSRVLLLGPEPAHLSVRDLSSTAF